MSHIDESLKQYCKIILTDIINNTKSFQHNYNYFQNKNMLDHQSRKEMIIRKLDELEVKQEEIIKQIPNIDESLKYFEIEKKAMEERQDIEKILENMHKTKLSFVKATEIFHEVNNKEKDVRDFNHKVLCYKLFCEVHEKIDENYKIIEKAIEQVEKFDYSSILKKGEEKVEESNNFKNSPKNSNKKTISKSYKLEITTIDSIGENENVLQEYKIFNIFQNGNFTLENDSKDIIKGKFTGEKLTMQKLGANEDIKSIFFEGILDKNKLKIVYDFDSTFLDDKLNNKEYMIEINLKLDKFKINKNDALECEVYLNRGDEFDNKFLRNGVGIKDNKIFLLVSDFTIKNFCKVNLMNTEGSEEITGTSFNISESDKIINIKQ